MENYSHKKIKLNANQRNPHILSPSHSFVAPFLAVQIGWMKRTNVFKCSNGVGLFAAWIRNVYAGSLFGKSWWWKSSVSQHKKTCFGFYVGFKWFVFTVEFKFRAMRVEVLLKLKRHFKNGITVCYFLLAGRICCLENTLSDLERNPTRLLFIVVDI